MPVIVVTRLRLRDPALLDEFFTDAVAAIEQATKSEGNLGADALADADNAWWSVTAWQERRLMQAYVDSEPHLGISARLDHYATRPRSSTGSRPAPPCRTGRPVGATSPPTVRPPTSPTRRPQIRPSISRRPSSRLPAFPETLENNVAAMSFDALIGQLVASRPIGGVGRAKDRRVRVVVPRRGCRAPR